jgi:iron complex outermembrane receptor protein
MIQRILFSIITLFSFSQIAKAQTDSFPTKNILLKEIIIQNEKDFNNAKEKKQPKDLQTSTEDVLSGTNGVNLIRRGNFAQEPTIRGLNAGQINMTIDGMAIFGACTDRMDPVSSYIEPNNLQSIIVSYGANDMAFGTSIGGGFNFKIKQPRINAKDKWDGMVGLGYETNGNALQTLAGLNYSGKRVGVNVNGIFRTSNDYRAGGGEKISFSQYNKWNGSVAAKYQLSAHQSLQLNYIQDEGYNIGYPALTMDVAFAKAKIGSISYKVHGNNGWLKSLETKLFYNFIDHAMDDTKRPKSQVPMHMDMPGTSTTSGFYSEAIWNYKNHEIKTRINGYQNRLHAEMTMYPNNAAPMYMLTIPDAQRNLLGFDLSDQIDLNKHWQIQVGGRMDIIRSSIYSEAGEKTLSGMNVGELSRNDVLYTLFVNPVYKVNDQLSIYTNVARTMRAATLQELYGFYLFNRVDSYDYLGNPSLKDESSWNLSLGTIFTSNKIKIELVGFGYFMQNYIAGIQKPGYSVMTIGAKGVKQYGNLSTALLTGVEASVNFKITPNFQFSSNNTYTRGTDNSGGSLPMISPFKTVNQLSYQFKNILLNCTSIFSVAQNHVNTAFYGETNTSSYHLMNLKAGRTFSINSKMISVNIGVDNLLDAKYADHLDIMKIPRPGRNFITHLTYTF